MFKPDAVLADAADQARDVLLGVAEPDSVGAHLGMDMVAERLAVHRFACLSRGYVGWEWVVSVTRIPRSKAATVCETNLLPADGALLSPAWVPYAERLAPGDLGPGDVLPFRAHDDFLEPGFSATGEEDVDTVGFHELGLGRPRVLSREGRTAAAERWYEGEFGPGAAMATKSGERCSGCGYFVPMAGILRQTFGVCANEWSPADGKVVALCYGCGAHSETDLTLAEPVVVGKPLIDDYVVDPLADPL